MNEVVPYCGSAPSPASLASSWNFDPALLLVLALLPLAYLLLARTGPDVAGSGRRHACFAAAWLVLVLAFVSPLCALGSALFAARVTHHLLLVALAAPLLALAWPRRGPVRPAVLAAALGAHVAALWIWHAPQPYAAALSSDRLYWIMETTLLGSALLLWRELLAPAGSQVRVLLAHLAVIVQMGLLGALITFAPRPLYAAHFLTTQAFGLSALEDQQLAGLIMWVPSIAPYLVAALVCLSKLLSEFGERQESLA